MYDLGYLAIDVELGGSGYFRGTDAILEIAVLPFPNPTSVSLGVDSFLSEFIREDRVTHHLIKPYANVDSFILSDIVKKPLDHYEKNGADVSVVSQSLVGLLKRLQADYKQLVSVADWHGDPIALDYLLSLSGETVTNLLRSHNMLHIKSFARGKFGGAVTFEQQKRILGVNLTKSHQANQDCKEVAEVTVRALCHARTLMRTSAAEQTRVKT